MKIYKKVWVVWKKHTYVFCSYKWELSDENNFSQHKLTFNLLPRYMFSLRSRLKNTQNHDVAKGLGVFVSVGVQTSILHPSEVQRVLSPQPKPFCVMMSILFLDSEWNLVKSRFWPYFLTILCTIQNIKKIWPKSKFYQISLCAQKWNNHHDTKRFRGRWKDSLNFIWM